MMQAQLGQTALHLCCVVTAWGLLRQRMPAPVCSPCPVATAYAASKPAYAAGGTHGLAPGRAMRWPVAGLLPNLCPAA